MTVCWRCGRNVFENDAVCANCGVDARAPAHPAGGPPAGSGETHGAPFDRRTEVSADARHLVKHLWVLLFVMPCVATLLWLLGGLIVGTWERAPEKIQPAPSSTLPPPDWPRR
jgi:hypothetical protein